MGRNAGTGIDPRYPKGVVVDISDHNASELTLIDKGFVVPVSEIKSDVELANAAVRGEIAAVPTASDELEAAVAAGITDEAGYATAEAHRLVHEEDSIADVFPETAVAEAPVEEAPAKGRGKTAAEADAS